MIRWTRWSNNALLCGAMSLALVGCLEEDPNQDDDTSSGTAGTDGSGNGPGNGPGGTASDSGNPDETANPDDTGPNPTETSSDDVTIYDIQMGNVTEGTVVTLSNVVVTSPVNAAEGGVTVQEMDGGPFSGIYLYLFDEVVTGVPLNPGDIVTLTGEYSEFFDSSQITITSVDSISVMGNGAVPDPITVQAGEIAVGSPTAEDYEGVLVRVENVTATDATNEFGDFHVDDGLVISNFWLFQQGGQLDVLPGTALAFAQGPLLYSFEEYKLAPRTDADYDATLVACADAAPDVSINDVQQGNGVNVGDLVLLTDVVVTTPWNFDQDTFYVQEPAGGAYSGISVFVPNAPEGFTPTPGMQITLCGEYDEFFDQSQIQVSIASDVQPGATGPAPSPEDVSADVVGSGAMAEMWEGVLVQVSGSPTVTMEANEFGEWQLDDVLLTSPLFFETAAWPTPALDTVYTHIVGVMSFSFENYKLAPRTVADFEDAP